MNSGARSACCLQGRRYLVREFIALFAVSLAITGSAFAQPSGESMQQERRLAARQHFDQGLAWASQHDYAQALQEFLEAYRKIPHYAVQYNIGQTYIALGLPVEAVSALERYLSEGRGQIDENRVREVRAQIQAERARIAEVMVTVNTPKASIQIDGQEIGHAPLPHPVRVAAGNHVIAVISPDGTQLSRPVTLLGLEQMTLRFELPAAPAPMPVSPTPPSASSRDVPRRVSAPRRSVASESGASVSTLGYALGVVGIVLGAVAVGDYLWNRGRYQQWRTTHEQLQANPQVGDYSQRQAANNDLANSIRNASYVTVGLSVASGLLTATGVTLVVLDRRGPAATATEPRDRAVLLSLRGAW